MQCGDLAHRGLVRLAICLFIQFSLVYIYLINRLYYLCEVIKLDTVSFFVGLT